MILESLKYIREEGRYNQWSIEGKDGNAVSFNNINLFVGKNAVGKSRSLEVLCEIGCLLSLRKRTTDLKFPESKYVLNLKEDGIAYEYTLVTERHRIVEEILVVDGFEKFNRAKKKIYSEVTSSFDKLDIADTEVITSVKGKNKEYSYIGEICEWGNAIRNYTFINNQYEQNQLLKHNDELDILQNDTGVTPNSIIQLFFQGKQEFGQLFVDNIVADLQAIGYQISSIDLLKDKMGIGISVQEEELNDPTTQLDMSQGMFRALSFLIQLEFAMLTQSSACLLIDDLGDGLDFHRSTLLIDIIISKISNSCIQLFLTSNDRYIMNKIPLRYWSVIERKPKVSIFHNYHNAQQIFEEFKYTGLSNFDFLASDFYRQGFSEEE